MDKATYDRYWNSVVITSICDIEKELNRRYNAVEIYKLKKQDLALYKNKIFKSYEDVRDMLKQQFFQLDENKPMENSLIDIHKIAACFCKSMLENKIFIFELKENIPVEVMLCNYTLAFSSSLGIMYLNLLGQYKKEQHIREYDYLKQQKKFALPDTNEGHDSYLIGRVKTLALNDIYGVTFDLLTYSDMMFWIEDYNKKIIKEKA